MLTYRARLTPADVHDPWLPAWDVEIEDLGLHVEGVKEGVMGQILTTTVACSLVESGRLAVPEALMVITYPRQENTIKIEIHTAKSLGLGTAYATGEQLRDAARCHEELVEALPEGAVLKLIPGPDVWDVRRVVATFMRMRGNEGLGVLPAQALPAIYSAASR